MTEEIYQWLKRAVDLMHDLNPNDQQHIVKQLPSASNHQKLSSSQLEFIKYLKKPKMSKFVFDEYGYKDKPLVESICKFWAVFMEYLVSELYSVSCSMVEEMNTNVMNKYRSEPVLCVLKCDDF